VLGDLGVIAGAHGHPFVEAVADVHQARYLLLDQGCARLLCIRRRQGVLCHALQLAEACLLAVKPQIEAIQPLALGGQQAVGRRDGFVLRVEHFAQPGEDIAAARARRRFQAGGVLGQRLVERSHSRPLFEQFRTQRLVEQASAGQRHRLQQARAHSEDVEDGRDQHSHERAERQNGQGLYGVHQHAPYRVTVVPIIR